MTEIVNLNRFRKAKRKSGKNAQAAANRLKFGRTKVEKASDDRAREQGDRTVDGAKRDDPGRE